MDITSLPTDEVYETLNTSPDGLTSEEARTRLQGFGPNEIKRLKKTPLWVKLASQFVHFFAILLWIAAGLAFAAQLINPEEETAVLGFTIIGVIVINAVFTFFQEYKAEKAAEALQKLLAVEVTVVRDGEEMVIPAREVVPGDVLALKEGDRVPADARLVEEFDMRVNNAALTGESEPVTRTSGPSDAEQIESPNLVFSGTNVVRGVGRAVVYATGMSTEFGRIANLTQGIEVEPSPLELEVVKLTRIVAILATGLGIVFFIAGEFAGRTFIQNFLFAIGIIVANVPEGLLPTVTLSLAVGSQRMAGRNALIKNLGSVETLGATTVICTDKTGTLTQNQMTVRRVYVDGRTVEVSGTGYQPKGEFLDESGMPLPIQDTLEKALEVGALANDAKLVQEEDRWDIVGDPTEGALLVSAAKTMSLEELREEAPRVYEIPFSSERKRMSTVNEIDGRRVAHVKGALESILSRCNHIMIDGEIREIREEDRRRIREKNDEYALAALRVLALAYKVIEEEEGELDEEGVESDLVFVGLVGMIDPPRPEVRDAIDKSRDAGIRVLMITGDYSKTAEAIAQQIGLISGTGLVVTGSELSRMSPEDLHEALDHEEVVFARMSPSQKLRVVDALKTRGEVVAVTGTG